LSITDHRIDGELILSLLVMLLFLAISGFISGSEVAFFSLSPGDIDKLKQGKGRLNRMVLQHLQAPERLLATILITNNFVNVGIVVLSTFITNSLFSHTGPPWIAFLIQVVAITALILFISEIFPKVYANRFSIQFARLTAPALKGFGKLFWPISTFLIYSTSMVNRRLIKHRANISIDDLSTALELTEPNLSEEKNILKGIVKFGNIDVCDIMRSRVDVIAVEIKTSFSQLLKIINDSGFSRIPVYQDNFDQVKGILYIKDLLPHLGKTSSFKWQSLIRPTYYVPESKKINDLLKEFQSNHIHMAVVVDEYGGTSGIVTLEDILEEIVGEITDESDNERLPYEKIDDQNFLFDGKVLLNDVYKILEIDDDYFETVKGDADTLAGLILELRGEIPPKDVKISYRDLIFTVIAVDARRIKKIKVTIRVNTKK
jgi:putative hemolysin